MKVSEILKVTNGKMIVGDENQVCENFSKDTRIIEEGDVYIGIKGEKYDGNLFWKDALENGASVVIVENIKISDEEKEKYKQRNKTIIEVGKTLIALKEIAKYKRSLYDIPVVAVTGSVGKTSTKDIIAEVLNQKYKTLKTQGNMNNDIGLPFTILNLRDHEAAVIEMGMNHFGEISELTKIAKPTLAVITNIGTSHIGNLGSRENILKAKLEILEGMDEKKLVINNDNDLLNHWYKNDLKKYNIDEKNVYTYGIENKGKINAKNIVLKENSSEFECEYVDEGYSKKLNISVGGLHFVYNAMCAAMVGKIMKLNDEQIKNGIEKFELTKRRMDIVEIDNGIKIINDSYNASYESMKASIEYLKNTTATRKIAVLGDMFELGNFAKELHEKVGEEVAKNNIDILICSGENSKNIIKKAIEAGMNKENIYYFENKNQIVEKLKKILIKGDVVLIKASNGMKYFEIVNELLK
jgi:UDP-N-acetylmuramoyl-tripeptide--D-alanyl-D-alanine ligase